MSQLANVAGKIPVHEFNKLAVEGFRSLQKEIMDEIADTLGRVKITENGVDMAREGLKAPTSTWTYLVNDNPERESIRH